MMTRVIRLRGMEVLISVATLITTVILPVSFNRVRIVVLSFVTTAFIAATLSAFVTGRVTMLGVRNWMGYGIEYWFFYGNRMWYWYPLRDWHWLGNENRHLLVELVGYRLFHFVWYVMGHFHDLRYRNCNRMIDRHRKWDVVRNLDRIGHRNLDGNGLCDPDDFSGYFL